MKADLLALALLTIATYATRAVGLYLANVIGHSARVRSLLISVSGCVLATLITPSIVLGDAALRVGLVAALLAFAILRNSLAAIVAAVIATAAARSFW